MFFGQTNAYIFVKGMWRPQYLKGQQFRFGFDFCEICYEFSDVFRSARISVGICAGHSYILPRRLSYTSARVLGEESIETHETPNQTVKIPMLKKYIINWANCVPSICKLNMMPFSDRNFWDNMYENKSKSIHKCIYR